MTFAAAPFHFDVFDLEYTGKGGVITIPMGQHGRGIIPYLLDPDALQPVVEGFRDNALTRPVKLHEVPYIRVRTAQGVFMADEVFAKYEGQLIKLWSYKIGRES